ncbi:hypothetical protein [Sphaerimonospora thailandensis]|uniref:Uncharacterized protein n=1 Tax=Sphaerimonospora thailandensis TaxID=795644 RepID=A0A8J3RE57_9ACTN|nr:hypothetical protein [Sphaerimonospora thailandensis]GIH73090.1 hypothetical protein Mth01_53430 [Sphaerimonospora thailandensis]
MNVALSGYTRGGTGDAVWPFFWQLYAVPAMLGSTAMAVLYALDVRGFIATLSAAVLAFAFRILAMRYGWRAPLARGISGPRRLPAPPP